MKEVKKLVVHFASNVINKKVHKFKKHNTCNM